MLNFSKTQKLFLNNILFHLIAQGKLLPEVEKEVKGILLLLQDDLLSADTSNTLPSDDESCEEEYEDEIQDEYVDFLIEPEYFLSLKNLRATNCSDDEKGTIEFFQDQESLGFTWKTDSDHVKDFDVYDVKSVVRRCKSIQILTYGGELYKFYVSKFSKEWTSSIETNKVYGI